LSEQRKIFRPPVEDYGVTAIFRMNRLQHTKGWPFVSDHQWKTERRVHGTTKQQGWDENKLALLARSGTKQIFEDDILI